ncbi:AMP-dependent synthetase/ligase domain-containing protein [Madurella fahalii]|uniref:AMP-dependent synthetase/ligase domain-containing protein n=1 Tax=Madurella fahalii TaxID=1157608 RepID=A0ABQ0FYL7_9PEZI
MSPSRIDEHYDGALRVKHDRFPPCLFPALHHSPPSPLPLVAESASEFGSVLEPDFLPGREWHEPGYHVDPLTLCKAAWLLTLKCFVQTDILCFAYEEVTAAGGSNSSTNHGPVLYFARVDGNEEVWSFLRKLAASIPSVVVTEPRGHEVRAVKGEFAAGDFGNTMLCYYKESSDGLKLRVSDARKLSGMDIVVGLFKESTGRTSVALEFRRAHTSRDVVTSVLRTFQHIASQMFDLAMTAPDRAVRRLRDIDVCSAHDWQLVRQLTASVRQVKEECLHDMIVAQCRKYPNRTAAISTDGQALTYGELDDLSQRLAYRLVQLGVKPETFVLSCFEKSIWAVVARLAILRAGGAYISIHATNPPAYLNSVVSRTGVRILVCDTRHANRFRHLVPITIETGPNILRSLPVPSRDPVCDAVRPENACLILFTSGSTGKPKGIVQMHRSYATAIHNYAEILALDETTRYLSFDDYAFDISNLEFMVPLVTGGCCCVPGPMKTVKDLAYNINALKANAAFLTPTVAVKLDPADVPSLKILCVGGEPLPAELVNKWSASSTRLVNQYGMGEAAISCCYNDKVRPGRTNVGRPTSGAVFVVDAASYDKLLPVGAVGELLMEGPHLARGYLDQTAARRTEAVFLEAPPVWMSTMHPARASAGARPRLYRSGDLGRWNHDGTIDYIGRKDNILKLDGCRIDALEVEHQARKRLSPQDTIIIDILGVVDGEEDPVLTALLHLEGHSDSAVRASATALLPGEPSVMDAAADPHAAAKVAEIKEAIAGALPAYMVPALFLQLSHVPRTSSKKTDRRLIHHVGQKYHLNQRVERNKNPTQARKARLVLA